jgi:DNA polymerase-3 subunit chi
MIEIAFYHLTRRSLEQVLPNLLERSRTRGWRACVQATNERLLARLDDHLWSYRPESFLPHGTAADGAPESQPVYLTTGTDNPNGADVRFFIEGAAIAPVLAEPASIPRARAVLLFEEADRTSAREQWRELLPTSHHLTYWQEDDNGKFEKKRERKA